jgi:hypothetical protein
VGPPKAINYKVYRWSETGKEWKWSERTITRALDINGYDDLKVEQMTKKQAEEAAKAAKAAASSATAANS